MFPIFSINPQGTFNPLFPGAGKVLHFQTVPQHCKRCSDQVKQDMRWQLKKGCSFFFQNLIQVNTAAATTAHWWQWETVIILSRGHPRSHPDLAERHSNEISRARKSIFLHRPFLTIPQTWNPQEMNPHLPAFSTAPTEFPFPITSHFSLL